MTSHRNRLLKLEAAKDRQDKASQPTSRYTDEQRLASMKHLSEAIAEEMQRQGLAPADVPAAALPLAIAEVLRNDKS
jgi:hypothetical protein